MSDLSLRRSSVFSLNAAPRRSNTLNLQNFVLVGALLGLVSILSLAYLLPIGFVASYSLKSESQLGNGEILPMTQEIFMYNGERLLVYNVEIEGVTRKLALISSSRSGSVLLDPADPDAGTITTPQRAATLDPAVYLDPHPETFVEAAQTMNLPLALRNTLAVALIGGVGVVISSAMVAYGFSRYRVPGANIMFFVLLSTMILPGQVTLIPLFILYQNLGWTGTILPLVVPHFFAGAYNVFLLRQYFLTIPIEMDEAARVDGANPLQTFLYIIVPQSKAALVTVA
ncbi:MAG: carbohydrate ABC transporter permease, partial [Anaerolinea sp.]|nr:carbohydrate ABC transporter permease [Anaerolinea sp.]